MAERRNRRQAVSGTNKSHQQNVMATEMTDVDYAKLVERGKQSAAHRQAGRDESMSPEGKPDVDDEEGEETGDDFELHDGPISEGVGFGDGMGVGPGWETFLPQGSLRVLLVEDDDSTRHVVGALLRNCSYEGRSLARMLARSCMWDASRFWNRTRMIDKRLEAIDVEMHGSGRRLTSVRVRKQPSTSCRSQQVVAPLGSSVVNQVLALSRRLSEAAPSFQFPVE